jgi:glycosyltransferase involved in cell wall biosynthesis
MFIGRVVRQKGVDTLLHAAAAFGESEIEVVVIGSSGFDAAAPLTEYERELRVIAAQVPPRVVFRSFVDRGELPSILKAADVLCVPSRWVEASGLTVGEGLAAGVPVVASRLGGIPEALGPGGILVAPDDPMALAAALRRLHDDPQLGAALSLAGREWAEAHDWTWAWGRLREVLRQV